MSDYALNVSDTRIAATYSTRERVHKAKAILQRKLGLSPSRLEVVAPNDGQTEEKLEGRSEKVGDNMLNLHFFYGAAGLILGMIVAFLLVNFGPAWTQQNPMFTYIALISPGLFIGLFLAGFLSLKPEHDMVNQKVVESQQHLKWTLVVDTEDTDFSRDDIVEEIEQTEAIEVQK